MATAIVANCSFNGTRNGNCSKLYSNLSSSYFSQPLVTKAGKMGAYVFVAILALLGNVFVIAIISRNKHLRKAINYFILNMAVSDLVIPVVIIPIQVYSLSIEFRRGYLVWPMSGNFGSFLCKLAMFLADSSPVVSIMSLVFMTADRFHAVVFPLKAQRVSFKIRLALLASSWLIAFAFFSLYFQVVRVVKIGEHQYCELSFSPTFDHTRSMQIFSTTACVLFIVLPFILLSVMYSVMLFILKKQTIAKSQALNIALVRRQRNNRNVVFMALAIVLAFAVCWGPYNGFVFIVTIVWRWKFPSNLKEIDFATFQFVTHFLTCANAALNPCIYFIFIQSYRSALKKLFCNKSNEYIQRSVIIGKDSDHCQGKTDAIVHGGSTHEGSSAGSKRRESCLMIKLL